MRNLASQYNFRTGAGHNVLLIYCNPRGTCRDICGHKQLYPPPDLFNIKIHETLYMFWPAVAILRGSPMLWGNILHVCYTYVLHRDFFTIKIKN
jgi:hypothetical protein